MEDHKKEIAVKINLAKSAGFCFGVKRAIELALKAAASGKNIRMLGDIVHNEDVTCELEKAGIKKIKNLPPGKNKTLIIRAHGAPREIYRQAGKKGYKIIDATCPMVQEIHNIARKMEKDGCKLIIIGDKEHDEVAGIKGNIKKTAIVVEELKKIPLAKIRRIKKACILAQSTQDTEKVLKIAEVLKKNIKQAFFFNTVCQPTRKKQREIKTMPLKNDLMIIIGSRTSANTRRLYEISKSLNKRSYWIQSAKDIRKAWLKKARRIGVTAGASTPESTTSAVIRRLQKLT